MYALTDKVFKLFERLFCHSVYLTLFCRCALLSPRSFVATLILPLSFVARSFVPRSNVVDSIFGEMTGKGWTKFFGRNSTVAGKKS
jgi:hypothetical protein